VFSISRIGQVQVIFRARFAPGAAEPRFEESLEVRLFRPAAIPAEAIAFPSVHWALDAWRASAGGPLGAPARNPAEDPRGAHRLPGAAAGGL
jgi:hypothetical protein